MSDPRRNTVMGMVEESGLLSNAMEQDNSMAIPANIDWDFIPDVRRHPFLCALFLLYMYIKSSVMKATEHVGSVLNGKCAGFAIDWYVNIRSGMVHNDCKNMGVSKKVESNNGAEIISCGPFIAAHAAKIKHGEAAAMEDFTSS